MQGWEHDREISPLAVICYPRRALYLDETTPGRFA
jgi:hypothetical protein